jgi:tRNA threonylcarbamoyladenosine biosynthesis protein TsaE
VTLFGFEEMNNSAFISHSEEDTVQWAIDFSRGLKPEYIVGLEGDLGSGKTVIARGIARGLHFKGHVNSPSYTLVNEYQTAVPIYHIDLYRLDNTADWEEIGIEHYLNARGICIIEWPERLFPQNVQFNFIIHIDIAGEHSREISVEEFQKT